MALEDFSVWDSPYHKISPVARLLTAVLYVGVVASFGKYDLTALFPMILYPFFLFVITGFPFWYFVKRVLAVQTFVLAVGIFGFFYDSYGLTAFTCLMFKSILMVTAVLLLVASAGIDNIGAALRALRLPKIFVLQLTLTYRYIAVILKEASRAYTAYSLKAPGQKGIAFAAWGSFSGQLLLRVLDRADRIYSAMLLRGFEGEYNTGGAGKTNCVTDIIFFLVCVVVFLLIRLVNIPVLIGNIF